VSKVTRVISAAPKLAARAQAEQRDRRSRWLHRFAWASAAVVPLAFLGWLLLGSSVFAVDRVIVTGQHRVSAAEVERAAAVSMGTPLARVDTDAAADRVRELDAIASVTVTRGWPNTVRVAIVERTAAVAVKDGNRFDLVDAAGVQFDSAATAPKGVLRLEVRLTDTDAKAAALEVIRGLPLPLRARVGIVKAPSEQQVILVLKDNRVVIWGDASKPSQKAAAVTALLKLPGKVYDVSSPEVVTRR
jgi:cell division protein FtsQ